MSTVQKREVTRSFNYTGCLSGFLYLALGLSKRASWSFPVLSMQQSESVGCSIPFERTQQPKKLW